MTKPLLASSLDRWNWNARELAMPGLFAVLNYFLLSLALVVSLGFLDFPSLAMIVLVLVLALGGSCLTWPEAMQAAAKRLVPHTICFVVAAEFAGFCCLSIGLCLFRGISIFTFVLGAAPLALLIASYGWTNLALDRWRFWAILGLYGFLGAWQICASPPPKVDVWHFQQQASRALLAGEDPYATEYPNVLSDTSLYSPAVFENGKVQSFPYTPLSLLVVLPGYLVGDVRWSLLLAMVATGAFLVATGRKLGLPAGHIAELAAVAFLCHPLGLSVLEYAWTEPLVTLAASFCVWALVAGRDRMLGVGLGALLCIKQYAVLGIVPYWSLGRLKRRHALVAGAVATGINLPFFLWDPAAFWKGLVTFQTDSPFRPESLTVLAAVDSLTGYRLPSAVGFLAAAAAALLVVLRGLPSLTTQLLGSAAIFLAFFAFSKGAHINYYWFVGSLLPMAIIMSAGEWADRGKASVPGHAIPCAK